MHRYSERVLQQRSTTNSQETRSTSTPNRLTSSFPASPNMSPVSGKKRSFIELQSEDDGNSDTSLDDLLSLTETHTFNQSEEIGDYENFISKLRTIKWKGNWSDLKPKNENSLYYKIMSQPFNTEEIVQNLFANYQQDKEETIYQILQFFIDISGFQETSIKHKYKISEVNAKEFIESLQTDQQGLTQMKGKFLFKLKTNMTMIFIKIVSNFLNKLIFLSFKYDALFDEVFSVSLSEFIQCMSFSSLLPIHVSGVIICLKILSALLCLLDQLVKFMADNRQTENIDLDLLNVKKQRVVKFVEYFFIICDKNCLIPNNKCNLMRALSAQEMLVWMNIFPKNFIIERRCFGRLMRLVYDEDHYVRKCALETCVKLVGSKKCNEALKHRIDLCFRIVISRIRDVKYDIAVKAVEVFTEAINLYHNSITSEFALAIIFKMFQQNLLLAKAAGKFVVGLLSKIENEEESLLMSLVKVVFHKKEFAERLPLMVESCIEFTPVFKNWNLIVKVLLNNEVDLERRKRLLEVATESVHYSLKGQSSIRRQSLQPALLVSLKEHNSVAVSFLPQIRNLIQEFSSDKSCTKLLIDILGLIDYSHCHADELINVYSEVFSLMKDLFRVSSDKDLLEKICNLLHSLSEKNGILQDKITTSMEKINKYYVITVFEDLAKLAPESAEELAINLRINSLKLSILFSKFNLTSLVQWRDIFGVCYSINLELLKYLVVCSKWYLIWRVRKIKEDPLNDEHSTFDYIKQFINGCLEVISKYGIKSISFFMFEHLFDLYKIFAHELRGKQHLKHFLIKVEEDNFCQILANFVTHGVVDNKTLNLEKRRKYFTYFVDLLLLGILPAEFFSKVMRFYHSRYDEYGPIMDYILTQLKNIHPGLACVIIDTMAKLYLQILEKNGIVDVTSSDTNELKLLAKKFSSCKQLSSNQDVLKVLLLSFGFSLPWDDHIPFLYFVRYFVDKLDKDTKSDAYAIFKQRIKGSQEKNVFVLQIAKCLQPPK